MGISQRLQDRLERLRSAGGGSAQTAANTQSQAAGQTGIRQSTMDRLERLRASGESWQPVNRTSTTAGGLSLPSLPETASQQSAARAKLPLLSTSGASSMLGKTEKYQNRLQAAKPVVDTVADASDEALEARKEALSRSVTANDALGDYLKSLGISQTTEAQTRAARNERELKAVEEEITRRKGGSWDPLTAVSGVVQKGLGSVAGWGGKMAAAVEDAALAPFELFAGQKLGELSDTAPLNQWNDAIIRRNQYLEDKYRENTERGGLAGELFDEFGTATIAAVPQAVAAILTGGGTLAAQTSAGLAQTAASQLSPSVAGTVSRAVQSMAQNPLYWTSFAQVVGPGYEQAIADQREQGATDETAIRTKAALYAVGNGLLNAAVEIGGGIEQLPDQLQHGGSAWKSWVEGMIDEGKEEVVQGVIERGLQAVYGKTNPLLSLDPNDKDAIVNPATAAREFAGGAVVGGLLGGAEIGIDAARNAYAKANADFYSEVRRQLMAAQTENGLQEGQIQTGEPGEVQTQGQAEAAAVEAQSATEGQKKSAPEVGAEEVKPLSLPTLEAEQEKPANPNDLHIDERDWSGMGDRKIKAFQFDHPEFHEYFKDAAEQMLYDLNNSLKGQRFAKFDQDGYITGFTGSNRYTTEPVARALDDGGFSYAQIEKTLKDIIADNGQENYAAAKRVELILDDMLTSGFRDIDGYEHQPDTAYIAAKDALSGRDRSTEVRFNPLEDIDLLPETATTEGAEYNGQQSTAGEALSGADSGRVSGVGAGERDGGVAAGPAGGRARSVQAATARSRQDAVLARSLGRTSPLEAGVKGGSDKAWLTVMPEDIVDSDQELWAIREINRADGYVTRFFTGMALLENGASVEGWIDPGKGEVWIKADGTTDESTAYKINQHERAHPILDQPGAAASVARKVLDTYGKAELDGILAAYLTKYHGIYDRPGMDAIDPETGYTLGELEVVKEILADAAAGRNRFGARAGDMRQTVSFALDDAAEAGRQNAAAMERKTGPPANAGPEPLSLPTLDDFEPEFSVAEEPEGLSLPSLEDSTDQITPQDVTAIQQIGRVSVNQFSDSEIKTTEKFAKRYWKDMGTKSPFFRAWFGDWRANDTTPIIAVDTSDATPYSAGKAVNQDTGKTISWGATLKSETRGHGDATELSMLANIQQIVENAILLDTHTSSLSSNSKMKGTSFMHSFYAIVNDGKTQSLYKLFAEEAVPAKGGEPFTRGYELKYIEKMAANPFGVHQQNAGLSGGSTATSYTVADLFQAVKRCDPTFSPNQVSQVVDEDGMPLVVYHGTDADFNVFDRSKSRSSMDIQGNFFSPWEDDARGYGGNVRAFYLDIKNPADEGTAYKALRRFQGQNNAGALARDYLIQLGYDGVNNGGEEYIAFYPEQIKSADGNIGTFDRSSPDIRYSVDEEPEGLSLPRFQHVDAIQDATVQEAATQDAAAQETTAEDGSLFRPRGMSDRDYNYLNEKWKANRAREQAEKATAPVETDPGKRAELERQALMRNTMREEFKGTEALEKLGVKIENSVGLYDAIPSLIANDKAAKSVRKELKKAEKRLGATEAERSFASGIAAGIYDQADIPSSMRRSTVEELADYYWAERAVASDQIRARRGEINRKLGLQMGELFKDSDEFTPSRAIVLNNRTPERNMLHIFGDQRGAAINAAIFQPVTANEAEKIRFSNRMMDQVRTFRDQNGRESRLTKQERALVQQVIEGRAVGEMVAGMEMSKAIRDAGENIKNGKDPGDQAQEFGLDAEQRKLAVQYARWLETQQALESGEVDAAKVNNAAKKYGELFDQFYDAINDFLVAHGYEPIGFIKGYAPHLQPEDNANLLNKALQSMGINTDVTRLPSSIAGLTANYKPNKRWNPYFLSRTGDITQYDIAEAFESYVDYMSDVLYHTDDIMRVRQAANYFRRTYAPEEIRNNLEWAEELRSAPTDRKAAFLRDNEVIGNASALSAADVNKTMDEYVDKLYGDIQKTTKYSDLVMWLDNYANILAGKQSMADRGWEYSSGRTVLNIGNKLVRAFGKAQVAGNLSSALNQTAQIPQITAELGVRNTAKAALDLLTGKTRKGGWAQQSDFLTGKNGVDYLVTDLPDMVVGALFKPAEFADGLLSTLAVRGKYVKEISAGKTPREAMRAADAFGRSVMGDRTKGTRPLGFEAKNPVSQMVHVFQVEAVNSWEHLSQDLPRDFRQIAAEKGTAKAALALAGVIVKSLLGAFLLNRLAEEAYGGTPAPFDLLGLSANFIASGEGLTTNQWVTTVLDNGWEKLTGERFFQTGDGTLGGEFDWKAAMEDTAYNISNDVPYVRNVAGLLGLGDNTLPIPNLYGGTQDIISAAMDDGVLSPETGKAVLGLASELMPGGRQAKKTLTGLETVLRGGKYKGYGDGERLQYPVSDDFWTTVRAMMFGNNALPESREFYASGGSGLTTKQTELYQSLVDGGADRKDAYNAIRGLEPEDGKSSVTQDQKWEAIKGLSLPSLDEDAAAEVILSDTERNKVEAASSYGITASAYLDYKSAVKAIDDNGSITQAEAKAAIDSMSGLTTRQKAALWQMQNKSWKGEKNPYDTDVGREVCQALNGELEWISLPSVG